jgi:tetratricopeptide (TPR) repeat protein
VKAFSVALHLNKENASYCIAIGNCLMEMDVKSEALICYLNAVRLKPNNKTIWVALIRGLYHAGFYEEAITQLELAKQSCEHKPDFDYLQAAALFELGKSKEALLYLEKALASGFNKLKLFTDLNPENLKRTAVNDLIMRYKKK